MLILKSNDSDLELYLGRKVKVRDVEGILTRIDTGLAVVTSNHTYTFCDMNLDVEILEKE